jgi:two-component system, LuxR family, response regulator FixJ
LAVHRAATDADCPTVFVIDPDPTVGTMVRDLIGGSNLNCEMFTTGREFLAALSTRRTGCLVLEHRIVDMSGLQLQRRLAASGAMLPMVFVIAKPNVSIAVDLMRGGAVHVLEKPIRPLELLTAIQEAIALDQNRRRVEHCREQIMHLVTALSPKERVVLELIARGKSVKAMAAELELSVRAIEQRRHSLMEKIHVKSPLELVRFSLTVQRTIDVGDGQQTSPLAGRSDDLSDLTSEFPAKLASAIKHSGIDRRAGDRLSPAPLQQVPR